MKLVGFKNCQIHLESESGRDETIKLYANMYNAYVIEATIFHDLPKVAE